ncbi:beta-N-acetylhexosaminidase [Gynurincola endophyticus]|uniref:beta-N-acetylhexosaminidase n=1 Tax=Gynurincola endophyticus TaxID=2479004 RepID=UPI000F8D83E5|nr:beta-N-acetylhexosaminidase [Gynurincola endophyticus]
MKRFCLAVLFFTSVLSVAAQAVEGVHIIPQPVSLSLQSEGMIFNNFTKVELENGNEEAEKVIRTWITQFNDLSGYNWFLSTVKPKDNLPNVIRFILNAKPNPVLGKEGYTLEVAGNRTIITANQPVGFYYAIQTIKQLLPKEVLSVKIVRNKAWKIAGVKITDYPRFEWRGLMFDVVRHFFTKEEVKRFIDEMAEYKYNILHLHLSDDQGWRIEIKSLPKLTEVGAWRADKTGRLGTFSPPAANEPRTYGGFYTQEDIKELIAYAKDRYIEIMPEIDVPGHSMAAVAAYPELSCTPGTYQVNSGEKFMNWLGGGKFTAIVDNTLCPANEKVYEFLDKVYTEIAELFPFGYIHMGGDECAKNFWQKSAAVTELMKREKLKDYDEVQSYFVKRVSNIITSKGKKMMGWDEILEGGIAQGATIMSWRGDKGGIEAAKLGHEVVMTPNTFVYLDLVQGDAAIEPPNYDKVYLKKTFEFNPVPAGVDAKFIKGGQGNLWTEQIYNFRQVQYMLWPRAFAVANALWSQHKAIEWNQFVKNIEQHFERFDYAERKYAPSMYEPLIEARTQAGGLLEVKLVPEANHTTFHYSFDNSYPDRFYPKATDWITVPKDAQMLRTISYAGDKQVGRFITISIDELKKRAGSK